MTEPVSDPTTNAIAASTADREKLHAEVGRLEKALVAAYTDVEVLKAACDAAVHGCDAAERDRDAEHGRAELCSQDVHTAHAEIERLKKRGDTMFVKGYDQAVHEIRDHFAKAKQPEVARQIETIWLKRSTS